MLGEKKMNLIKKHKKLFAVMLTVALIIIIIAFVPSLRARFYLGDRIKGKITASVNGADFPLVSTASYVYDSSSSKKLSFDSTNFTIRGKGYGAYDLCFKLNNKSLAEVTNDSRFLTLPDETELHYVYINLDKLNRADIELNAELYNEGNMWKIRLTADYIIHSPSGKNDVYSEASEEYNYLYERDYLGVDFGM